MIKDKLHTITDSDAIEVSRLLLKSSQSDLYDFDFEKLVRIKYDNQDGTDAEECVNVYFLATVKNDLYRISGWKDERIMIQLIERDRYHDYPYFNAICKGFDDLKNSWNFKYISNYVEAIEYLQSRKLL